jgi:hypothetical protein
MIFRKLKIIATFAVIYETNYNRLENCFVIIERELTEPETHDLIKTNRMTKHTMKLLDDKAHDELMISNITPTRIIRLTLLKKELKTL